MEKRYNLAVLTSHPIQYQTPLYQQLATEKQIDLTVFFCSDFGVKPYFDQGFNQAIKWDIPLTEGYKSVFLQNLSPIPNVSKFFGLINPGIIFHLIRGNYDALLVHGWMRLTNWLAIITAVLLGIPIILRGESHLLRIERGWKRALKQILFTCMFKQFAAFLAIGTYNQLFYEHYGVNRKRIFLAPYAVNNDYFIQQAALYHPQKENLKRSFQLPVDRLVILCVGKLVPSKRPHDVLSAYHNLAADLNAALVFVGDGVLRTEIEARVKAEQIPHVYLLGFQNQTELPKVYAMSDIFIFASNAQETWGLVLNEAMCFGLPVIVSDQIGATGDLVKPEVNGYIYSFGDIEGMSKYLEIILRDNKLRTQYGNASRDIISSWNYHQNVWGILQCLESISLDLKSKVSPVS